jgi:ABC-type polysaccharide/polyol phosphate export permease
MSTSVDEANVGMSDPPVVVSVPERGGQFKCLPPEPVTKIRPGKFWEKIDFAEVWAHREVLYFLMWRDLKVRYKQTVMGAAWVILQPILMTLVFTIFLGKLIRVPSDGVPYPIFAYPALLLWTFTSNAVLSSSYSLVTNAQIITRVYFSRLLIPAATVGVRLVDLVVASLVLVALMFYYHVAISWSILMLPLFVIQIAVLVLAIGIWCAAVNVRYRDVGSAADSASGMDVCFPNRLFVEHRAGKTASALLVESARGNHQWFSRIIIQSTVSLVEHHYLCAGNVTPADFFSSYFPQDGD